MMEKMEKSSWIWVWNIKHRSQQYDFVATKLGLEKDKTTAEPGLATDIEETVGDIEENVVSSNGLELNFVEMNPMVSQQCIDKGDYEVKINLTEQNPRFNPGYSLQVEDGSIT